MSKAAVVATSLTLWAGQALADPVGDANAGMAALNHGDNAEAASLFTRAIISGQLSQSDLESAYVERAMAYAALQNNVAALADVSAALALNPNDPDALSLSQKLQAGAQSPPPSAAGAAPETSAASPRYRVQVCNGQFGANPIMVAEVYEPTEQPGYLRYTGWFEVENGSCHALDESVDPNFAVMIRYLPFSMFPHWAFYSGDTDKCATESDFNFTLPKDSSACPDGTKLVRAISLAVTASGVLTYTFK